MTQEIKQRPLNRLKSMYELRAEVDRMYEGGAEAKEEGKPVAWVMLEGWANAILNAMGVKTVFPENYSSVCAAQGMAVPFMDRAEAEGFPTHLCGYARTCVGYAARMLDMDGEIPPEAPGEGMPKPTLLLASARPAMRASSGSNRWGVSSMLRCGRLRRQAPVPRRGSPAIRPSVTSSS